MGGGSVKPNVPSKKKRKLREKCFFASNYLISIFSLINFVTMLILKIMTACIIVKELVLI